MGFSQIFNEPSGSPHPQLGGICQVREDQNELSRELNRSVTKKYSVNKGQGKGMIWLKQNCALWSSQNDNSIFSRKKLFEFHVIQNYQTGSSSSYYKATLLCLHCAQFFLTQVWSENRYVSTVSCAVMRTSETSYRNYKRRVAP